MVTFWVHESPTWTRVSASHGVFWVIHIVTSLSLRFITLPNSFKETWGLESVLRTGIPAAVYSTCLSMPASSEEGTWMWDGFRVWVPHCLWPFTVSRTHCYLYSATHCPSGSSSDPYLSWRRKPCSDAWSSLYINFLCSKSLCKGTRIQESEPRLCCVTSCPPGSQQRRECGKPTKKREALLSHPRSCSPLDRVPNLDEM